MAAVRYEYMAQQADVEGELDAAAVFRAVATSEDNHAMGHLEFMQDSGDPVANQPIDNTMEMLQVAIISEILKMTLCSDVSLVNVLGH
jgi:rubrerythrin